jgi:hypothetical protein
MYKGIWSKCLGEHIYNKPSSNAGVRFLENGAIGKSVLDSVIPCGFNGNT